MQASFPDTPIRAFYFQARLEVCQHNSIYRALYGPGEGGSVPGQDFLTYQSGLMVPTLEEGKFTQKCNVLAIRVTYPVEISRSQVLQKSRLSISNSTALRLRKIIGINGLIRTGRPNRIFLLICRSSHFVFTVQWIRSLFSFSLRVFEDVRQ